MREFRCQADSWRVRVVDDQDPGGGGAGVLLDDGLVLTAAHVFEQARRARAGRGRPSVRVHSVSCDPSWEAEGEVLDGSWLYDRGDERRAAADVVLLRLDRPPACGHPIALSAEELPEGTEVTAFGHPDRNPTRPEAGTWAHGQLVGSCGPLGKWRGLDPMGAKRPFIAGGFSGAGVVLRGGEERDRVVGIVAYANRQNSGVNGEIVPMRTALEFLGDLIGRYVRDGPGGRDVPRAVAASVARLLRAPWAAGAVVVAGMPGDGPGGWLPHLAGTSAARETVVCRAGGRAWADIREELADRLGVAPADDPAEPAAWLYRARPDARLVVADADESLEPGRLLDELLLPLAARAPTRGTLLVAGFRRAMPEGLRHQALISAGPPAEHGVPGTAADVPGPEPGPAGDRHAAEQAVTVLEGAEARLAGRKKAAGVEFFMLPDLPKWQAPQLRVLLAGADGASEAAVEARAREALREVAAYQDELLHCRELRERLTEEAELYAGRVESSGLRPTSPRYRELMRRYQEARALLDRSPVDLRQAREAVQAFIEGYHGDDEPEAGGARP